MTKYYVLFCLLFVAGCKSAKQAASAQEIAHADLTETYWCLTEINQKPAPTTLDNQPEIHLKLRAQSQNLQGFTGCNHLSGIYKTTGMNVIQFDHLLGNSFACPQATIEKEIIATLRKVKRYRIIGTKLFLSSNSKSPVICFEAVYF